MNPQQNTLLVEKALTNLISHNTQCTVENKEFVIKQTRQATIAM